MPRPEGYELTGPEEWVTTTETFPGCEGHTCRRCGRFYSAQLLYQGYGLGRGEMRCGVCTGDYMQQSCPACGTTYWYIWAVSGPAWQDWCLRQRAIGFGDPEPVPRELRCKCNACR